MKSEFQMRASARTDVAMNSGLTLAAGAIMGLVVFAAIFFSYRGQDVGQLPAFLHNMLMALGGERIASAAVIGGNVLAVLIAASIGGCWFGLGAVVMHWVQPETSSRALRVAWQLATGASLWSLLWFALGVTGWFRSSVALGLLLVGLGMAIIAFRQMYQQRPEREKADEYWLRRTAVFVLMLVGGLALIAALAPPTGKDALVYRLAVPKAYVVAGGIVDVGTNMLGFLGLGAEMHGVWALLLGNFVNPRVSESAFGAMTFLWLPVLWLAVYGFAREMQLRREWALVATCLVAAIPSMYQVATSGYVDHSLALFIVLAVQAAGKWWGTQNRQSLMCLAIALGGALAIKFIALFAFFPIFIIVLFKAREMQDMDKKQPMTILLYGCGALLLAGLLASPWYLRTWARTGSPVYPFYAHLWNGSSSNWDAQRAQLFQMWVARYGGDQKSVLDYVGAPLRLSLTAQPEFAAQYDGVLGISFLLGFPLLVWGLWRFSLRVEVKIAVAIAGGWYLCWLFSSQQMRFLLPIFPPLAVAIVATANKLPSRAFLWTLFLSVVPGGLVITAWFLEQNPLRAVLGGEAREAYLERRLDHYPYYQIINRDLPTNARVWLINMRNDTVHLERDSFADYVFEDYTITKLVKESANLAELRAQVKALGVTHILLRYGVLFDYARSPLVDERKSETGNQAKLQLLKTFLRDDNKVIKSDATFLFVELSPTS
jgi:hypothetical protein